MSSKRNTRPDSPNTNSIGGDSVSTRVQCSYCIETCRPDQLVNGCCQKCQERNLRVTRWDAIRWGRWFGHILFVILLLALLAWWSTPAHADVYDENISVMVPLKDGTGSVEIQVECGMDSNSLTIDCIATSELDIKNLQLREWNRYYADFLSFRIHRGGYVCLQAESLNRCCPMTVHDNIIWYEQKWRELFPGGRPTTGAILERY